jgi:hypothetical protein
MEQGLDCNGTHEGVDVDITFRGFQRIFQRVKVRSDIIGFCASAEEIEDRLCRLMVGVDYSTFIWLNHKKLGICKCNILGSSYSKSGPGA